MADAWRTVAEEPKTTYHLPLSRVREDTVVPTSGYVIYARHKSTIYTKMASDAETAFKEAGGGWPAKDESLWDYLRARRPALDINWASVEEQPSAEEHEKWKTTTLQLFHGQADDDEDADKVDEIDIEEGQDACCEVANKVDEIDIDEGQDACCEVADKVDEIDTDEGQDDADTDDEIDIEEEHDACCANSSTDMNVDSNSR